MRHQKKRWLAALLTLCMLLSILPSISLAFGESEETWSGNRTNQTIDGGTHTITLSNLTIDSPGLGKSAIDSTGNADVTFISVSYTHLRSGESICEWHPWRMSAFPSQPFSPRTTPPA